jgi:ubiquinone biosynthesis protein UbiJ
MRSGDAARLARVLGLLGSEYEGERASAALAAHRLVKRLGLTWQEVLAPKEMAVPPEKEALDAAESRLRQSQRENADLRRQITLLKRRLEALQPRQPPQWQGE